MAIKKTASITPTETGARPSCQPQLILCTASDELSSNNGAGNCACQCSVICKLFGRNYISISKREFLNAGQRTPTSSGPHQMPKDRTAADAAAAAAAATQFKDNDLN